MRTVLYLGLWANPPYDRLSERFAHLADDAAAAGYRLRVAHYDCGGSAVDAATLRAWLTDDLAGVILSGSRYDLAALPSQPEERSLEHYAPLMAALKEAGLPVLGICFGHQLVAASDGGSLGRLPAKRRSGDHPVQFIPHYLVAGLDRLPPRPPGSGGITVPENHGMVVTAVPQERWQILATSIDGIEAIAHRHWPWLGVQFHPEYHPESLSGDAQGLLLNWLHGLETVASPARGDG